MTMTMNLLSWRGLLAATLLCAPFLNACAERKAPAVEKTDGKNVPVSIHAVNHTAEPVSFVLTDPANKGNRGGGEIVNAFSAGGIMCCYSLPSTWRAGLKVEVSETYYLPQRADKSIPEVTKKHVLEVPRYADGKVGELWVTRGPGGAVTVVSTNYEPEHPSYPGAIKGWPVPDKAHQANVRDVYLRDAEQTVELYTNLLGELKKDQKKRAQEAWEFSQEHDAESLKPFSGPTDPAYLAMLKSKYTEELALAQKELKDMKAARP